MSMIADMKAEQQERRADAIAQILDAEWARLRGAPETLQGTLTAAREVARLCTAVEVYARLPGSDPATLAHLLRATAELRAIWINAYRERPDSGKTIEDRDAALVLRLWRAEA